MHAYQDIYDYAKSRFISMFFFINNELLQNIREVYKRINEIFE